MIVMCLYYNTSLNFIPLATKPRLECIKCNSRWCACVSELKNTSIFNNQRGNSFLALVYIQANLSPQRHQPQTKPHLWISKPESETFSFRESCRRQCKFLILRCKFQFWRSLACKTRTPHFTTMPKFASNTCNLFSTNPEGIN